MSGFDFIKWSFQYSDGARTALVDVDRSLNWNELEERVQIMAEQLRGLGLPRGLPVVVRGVKGIDMVVAMLACATMELPYVPVDKSLPLLRLNAIRKILGTDVLIGELSDDFSICIHAGKVVRQRAPAFRSVEVLRDPIVYVVFTSGSTGEPKGVQVTRGNIADYVRWLSGSPFAFSRDDVFVNPSAFTFDLSVFDFLMSLHVGGTLLLFPADEFKSAEFLRQRLAPLRPSVWTSTPSTLALLAMNRDFNSAEFSHLNDFYLCGETLYPTLVKRVQERFPHGRIRNTYGPTEATVFTTHVVITEQILEKYSSLPVGVVKPGTTIHIDEAGELLIEGPNVAAGYFARPELTAEKFRNGVYRTGDHGWFEDGMLFFTGRTDRQIKLHGFRIELDEIDAKIMEHKLVEQSVTLALKRDGEVKKIVSFIKLGSVCEDALAQIQRYLVEALPAFMIPGIFRLVESLPYNSSGKVDHKQLLNQL